MDASPSGIGNMAALDRLVETNSILIPDSPVSAYDITKNNIFTIFDQREQMVRYYGFYNNVSRGIRQNENMDDLIINITNLSSYVLGKFLFY
jgi:hypothetical protein